MNMEYDIYTGMLKVANDFERLDIKPVEFEYSNKHAMFDVLKDKYSLLSIAGNGNNLTKVLNLLNWVSNNIYHKGDSEGPNNALDILDYSFNKKQEQGINCLSLSIVLSECYLAIGLKSRVVHIMPLSPYDGDSHVIVDVYIDELNKWIMVDPTYGSYIMDKEENILGLLEIRDILSKQGFIQFNKEINYNGDDNIDLSKVKTYLAKNLYYFRCYKNQTYNSHNEKVQLIEFAPIGLDVKQRMIENIKYRIRKCGENKYFIKWLKEEENNVSCYASIKELEKLP